MSTLYLDSETQGPMPPRGMPPSIETVGSYPRAIQLAWQVVREGVVVQKFDTHILPAGSFEWSPQAEAVNRITKAFLDEHGHSTTAALAALQDALEHFEVVEIVAHNLAFDASVVEAELIRLGREPDELWAGRTMTCTMTDAAFQGLYGTKRWQKLMVAYETLCGVPWDEATDGALHDAGTDVECLKRLHESGLVLLNRLPPGRQSAGRHALVTRTADVAATLAEFGAGVRSRGGLNLLKHEIKAKRLRVCDVPGLKPT